VHAPLEGGGPGSEEVERVVCRGAGLGAECEEIQAGIGGELEYFVGEGEVADDGVGVALVAGLVGADVVRGPADAERVALGGELADEVCEVVVVRIAAGLGAEARMNNVARNYS